MPSPDLTPVTSIDEIEPLVQASFERPVVILKHSRSCGTSAMALDEVLDHLSRTHGAGARYAIVTVQTHRDVSTTLAARLGIRHETPQALVLRHGRVAWHASHYRVTAAAIEAAVEKAAEAEQPA